MLLKEEFQNQYKASGFLGNLKKGQRPAIIVVDFQKAFTNSSLSPLGGSYDKELKNTRTLLDVAREKKIPIIFCVIEYATDEETGLWAQKAPSILELKQGTELTEIDETLNHQEGEIIIGKKYASAFAGTSLISLLNAKNIDSLLITGTSTSGCVRATAVDAIQSGFSPFIVKDAVCDRLPEAHDNSLFDLQAKYADLLSTEEAVNYLTSIKRGN